MQRKLRSLAAQKLSLSLLQVLLPLSLTLDPARRRWIWRGLRRLLRCHAERKESKKGREGAQGEGGAGAGRACSASIDGAADGGRAGQARAPAAGAVREPQGQSVSMAFGENRATNYIRIQVNNLSCTVIFFTAAELLLPL